MHRNPYLSIVVTTRNDNHGGDLLRRTTCFVNGVYHQTQKFPFEVELIIVEWNPPSDKTLLKNVLPTPPEGSSVVLKYIIVPESLHNTYRMSDSLPLYQMIAKNVGIVRAQGEFVLCTNIDLLFSDRLFEFLSQKQLKSGNFYRAIRSDVPREVMDVEGFENQIQFAKQNVLHRLGKRKGHEYLFNIPDFVYGFSTLATVLNLFFKYLLSKLYEVEHFEMLSLDTHACGDFTLMAKSDWLKIDGYPELDLYSIHVDSMGLVAARALGINQVILEPDCCSYHIYHADGWESFKDSPIDLVKFIEKRPGLDWHSVDSTGKWMIKNKVGWGLNKPNWGWADKKFDEYVFGN
ncbi:MAG: hypothetical protein K9G41_06090 [Flavobacteriales bacterium]|nr:hypothetical protein [Flavobacteriales bacterium]